jgi:hypothetical protein
MATEGENYKLKRLIVAEDGCWKQLYDLSKPITNINGKPITNTNGKTQYKTWYINTNTQERIKKRPNGVKWNVVTKGTDTWYQNENTEETSWNPCIKSNVPLSGNGQNVNSRGEGEIPTSNVPLSENGQNDNSRGEGNVPLSENGQNDNSRGESWKSYIFGSGPRPPLVQNLVDYEYWNNKFKYENEKRFENKIQSKKREIKQRMEKELVRSPRYGGYIMYSVLQATGKFYLSYVFQTLDIELAKLGVDMLYNAEMNEHKRLIHVFTRVINDVFERLESHVTKIFINLHIRFPKNKENKEKFWVDVNKFVGAINTYIQDKEGVIKLKQQNAEFSNKPHTPSVWNYTPFSNKFTPRAPRSVKEFSEPELPPSDTGSGLQSLGPTAASGLVFGGARKKQRSTKKRHARNRRSRKVT